MPVMDEFKEERAAMKNGTPKQKLSYFWDYYKWHVIVGCAALAALATFIFQMANRKDTALYAVLLNSSERDLSVNDSEYTAAFAEYAGIDEKKYEIIYDTSIQVNGSEGYASVQKLMTYIAVSELDVIISDPDSLISYAYQENFYDLRQFLNAEQLERYGDSFFYIDGTVMNELSDARREGNYDFTPDYGDPRHPEAMQDPVPVGIYLGADFPLSEYYLFPGDECVACVMINTTRSELASKFLDFLTE